MSDHTGSSAIAQAMRLLEQRQSVGRSVSQCLAAANLDPLSTQFIENHVAVTRFFQDAISDVA